MHSMSMKVSTKMTPGGSSSSWNYVDAVYVEASDVHTALKSQRRSQTNCPTPEQKHKHTGRQREEGTGVWYFDNKYLNVSVCCYCSRLGSSVPNITISAHTILISHTKCLPEFASLDCKNLYHLVCAGARRMTDSLGTSKGLPFVFVWY